MTGMTLDDLLMVAGRLDDESGFDTARERFRRFLVERLTDTSGVRSLIEQSQYPGSEQHRRALQDLVALLGRFLGFSTHFASYASRPGERKEDGRWHSGRRVDIALTLCSDPAQLTTALAAPGNGAHDLDARALRLQVLTPVCEARARIDGMLKAAQPDSSLRVITLRTALSMMDLVGAGRLTHEDVVRLLETGSDVEFVIELLERPPSRDRNTDHEPAAHGLAPAGVDASFWVATVVGDQVMSSEQIILHEIGERHLLEISEPAGSDLAPRPGDGICLLIPGLGIVGSCEVRSVGERVPMPGDDHRFRRRLQLAKVVLHVGAPHAPGYEIQLRLRVDGRRKPHGHWLARISRDEFERVTSDGTADAHAGPVGAAIPNGRKDKAAPVTAADSPSHA